MDGPIIKLEKETKELKSKDLNNTEEIKLLKQHVEDLKKYNKQETKIRIENENQIKLFKEENKNQIKLFKEEVKELRKITATESCPHLIKQGVTRGEDVYLDPDGVNHGKKAAIIDNDIFYPLVIFGLDFVLCIYIITIQLFWGRNLTLIELFCN